MPKNVEACKILVAEDDKFLSRAYEFKLSGMGCQIIMAGDGEDAIAKIKSEKPDIILLDLIMPKKNGFEVLQEIKANSQTKKIPVIIMSNLGQEADIKKGLEAGAIDYIVKANVSLEEIVKRIATTLKRDFAPTAASASPATVAAPLPKTCPNCKKLLPAEAKFCPDCGKKVD